MIARMERRACARVPARCLVQLSYRPSEEKPAPARTLDLSEGGAAIESPYAFPLGADLAFFLVTSDLQVLDLRARVVHVSALGPGAFRSGVQFTRIQPNERKHLTREIERWLPESRAKDHAVG